MIYSIVNEFLGNITFSNPEAEGLLQAALLAEACLPASMQMRLQDVFSPIFYYFPKGVKDRSVWEPRDTSRYIAAWYRLGSMRNRFGLATVDSRQLNYEQVTQIFNIYMAEMMHNLLPHQHNKTQAYYRSCASAKLKDEAGSKNLAQSIWAIGLPPLPWGFPVQQHRRLSEGELQAIPWAINSVLNWLDLLAITLTHYHTTDQYQDAVRKAGNARGESGLTAAEQETRNAIRKAKSDILIAKNLQRQWEDGTLLLPWQTTLLRAYWNGSLHQRLEEASR